MFCANCGKKLNATNQRFCQNCGTENITISNPTENKTQRIQNVTTPQIYYAQRQQQSQIQMGHPGKYSKKCLGLALTSFLIGIVSLIVGYNFFNIYYSAYSNLMVSLTVLIVILVVRVGGLILGVFSKLYSSKAEIYEPYNDYQKAGSILGVMGIIINAIGIFLLLYDPLSTILNILNFI